MIYTLYSTHLHFNTYFSKDPLFHEGRYEGLREINIDISPDVVTDRSHSLPEGGQGGVVGRTGDVGKVATSWWDTS